MAKKGKLTLPGTYIKQKRPDGVLEVDGPTEAVPENRKPIHRLSWDFPQPRVNIPVPRVAEKISQPSFSDCDFFVDSSFLRSPVPKSIWDAILSRRVVIVPWVEREINEWIASPNSNPERRASVQRVLSNTQSLLYATADEQFQSHGYRYYTSLLLLRKLKGMQFALDFEENRGHPPTDQEFYAKFKSLGPGYDDLAVRLAHKGWKDYGKENYPADEQLVTMAVIHALTTGRETLILSRDHDIQVQFYKLVFLIDTHYRSMLLALRHADEGTDYHSELMLNVHPQMLRDRFIGEDDLFVDASLEPPTMWNALLPELYRPVMLESWWIDAKEDSIQLCRMPFCAEVEMAEVLKLKSSTNGMNTDLLSGKNCHIWPCPEGWLSGPWGAITTDKIVEYHDFEYRALDMIHALESREGHAQIVADMSRM